jgi:amidohydrolase
MDVGKFAIRPGALMASADRLQIKIEGLGGHAARPHKAVDSVLVGSAIVNALQQIVSRNIDPLENAVVSVTLFQAGTTDNVLPQTALLRGTARSLNARVRDTLERRVKEIAEGVAKLHGATAKVDYTRDYPVVVNHPAETEFAAMTARDVVGEANVDAATVPVMGGEDFSFMLERRPGAFIFMGNGDTANLHNPAYDFNDKAIPFGASYWVRLVERAMPA